MANTIEVSFVEQFRDTVYHKSQQKGSRLGNLVHYEPLVGEVHHFELLDQDAAVVQDRVDPAPDRHADSPILDAPHEKVRVSPIDTEWGDLIDREDKLRQLISPESEYIRLALNSLGRQKDDQIIAAMTGTMDIKTIPGAYVTQTFAAGGGVTIPAGGTGLTHEKVLEGIRALEAAEAYDEDDVCFVFGSEQSKDVRLLTELTSSDFVTTGGNMAMGIAGPSAANPNRGPFGLTWVRSERLPLNVLIRSCYMWSKRAMAMAVNEEMFARIGERADKKFGWQVFCRQTLGATRRETAGVVEILCDETP